MNWKLVQGVASEILTVVDRHNLSQLEKYATYKSLYNAQLRVMRKKGYTPEQVIEEKV
jgi:hypothetical protein